MCKSPFAQFFEHLLHIYSSTQHKMKEKYGENIQPAELSSTDRSRCSRFARLMNNTHFKFAADVAVVHWMCKSWICTFAETIYWCIPPMDGWRDYSRPSVEIVSINCFSTFSNSGSQWIKPWVLNAVKSVTQMESQLITDMGEGLCWKGHHCVVDFIVYCSILHSPAPIYTWSPPAGTVAHTQKDDCPSSTCTPVFAHTTCYDWKWTVVLRKLCGSKNIHRFFRS